MMIITSITSASRRQRRESSPRFLPGAGAGVASGVVRSYSQVTYGGVRSYSQVTSGGVRIYSRVTSGGVRSYSQVTSGGVEL